MSKKIMGLVLVVAVLLSMFSVASLTASAKKADPKKVGEIFEIPIWGKLSTAEEDKNIKDIVFNTEKSTVNGEILKIEQKGENIVLTCKATTIGEFVFSYKRYDDIVDHEWKSNTSGVSISTQIDIDEQYSFVIKGRKLDTADVYMNIKDLNELEGLKLVSAEQVAEGVKVTVQGVSAAETTAITYYEYNEDGFGGYEWNYNAVILSVSSEHKKNDPAPNSDVTPKPNVSPKTGDSEIFVWAFLALISVMGVAIVTKKNFCK